MSEPNFDNTIRSAPPVWMGDFPGRESILPVPVKLNADAFIAEDGVVVVVGAAGAAANATAVPVDALTKKIPSGTVLDFGAKKFARLTAEALAGATSLTVSALATALVDDDTATYKGLGLKHVPSGTLIGRTFAERDAGDAWGPAVVASDDEIFLTARDVADATKNNDTELYRHNRTVKENFLPNWSTLPTGDKTKIRALYTCIVGVK
jgi:hypothetical protein